MAIDSMGGKRERAEAGSHERVMALFILNHVLGQGRRLSEITAMTRWKSLSPITQARAKSLAVATLRDLERADRLLLPRLTRSPPLMVRNVLRLGTSELARNGSAYGVVNDLVNFVATDQRYYRFKGLVNAVLRHMCADVPNAWHQLPIPRMPKGLRRKMLVAWGGDVVAGIEKAHYVGASVDLSFKRENVCTDDLPGRALPTGSFRLENAGQISGLPGYDRGDWWVQDAASALSVRCLNPQRGERIIDLCAAPGGKTMQLSASGAEVVAIDKSAARMEQLRDNLRRTALTAECHVCDVRLVTGTYDAVVLDAPCSATGTIRRHPDLVYCHRRVDYSGLVALQRALIDHAWSLLRSGGRLVYSTCSLLPQEGEFQIQAALDRLGGVAADRNALNRTGIEPSWQTGEGGLRTRPDYWPSLGGMDGFYVAVLQKIG